MKIYTKSGDKGETGLYDGSRVLKSDVIVEALGNTDELNCDIGCIIANSQSFQDLEAIKLLSKIQHWLFDIGSIIAVPEKKENTNIVFNIDDCYTKQMEKLIDNMTNELPRLRNFILPGGSVLVSAIHKARAISRRAERSVVYLAIDNKYIKVNCLSFLNRLSDYLFTLARYIAFKQGINDVIYIKE